MWTHKTAIFLTLAALVLFLATPGLARADEGTGGMEKIINGYHVRLILSGPVKTGENQFHVQLTGADGAPVSGATIQAMARLAAETAASPTPADSMAGMSSMDMSNMGAATPTAEPMAGMNMDNNAAQSVAVVLQAGHDAGDYTGTLTFPQTGHWTLLVHSMLMNGEMFSAEFPLDVVSGTPASYGILAGFFGLSVIIIAAAAVTKRKTVGA